MNQKQILAALQLPAYDLTRKYAAKLSSLFSLVNELEKMNGFKC